MRTIVLAIVLAAGVAVGTAAAQGTAGDGSTGTAEPAGSGPPMVQRKVEILQHRPSGFWTSNRPATGGAYRWRMLGIGVVLAGGAGLLMWKLTRRANAERLTRNKAR